MQVKQTKHVIAIEMRLYLLLCNCIIFFKNVPYNYNYSSFRYYQWCFHM